MGSTTGEVKLEKEKYADYEIQSDADCLIRSEEIKADATKMKKIKAHLSKKKKAITSISGLKDKYNELARDEEE